MLLALFPLLGLAFFLIAARTFGGIRRVDKGQITTFVKITKLTLRPLALRSLHWRRANGRNVNFRDPIRHPIRDPICNPIRDQVQSHLGFVSATDAVSLGTKPFIC